MRFTEDMSIYDALQAHPKAREVFVAHGMGCIACMASTMETIAGGAEMHGVDAKIIVDELNKLVDEGEESEPAGAAAESSRAEPGEPGSADA